LIERIKFASAAAALKAATTNFPTFGEVQEFLLDPRMTEN
jgi:hypothetical protein